MVAGVSEADTSGTLTLLLSPHTCMNWNRVSRMTYRTTYAAESVLWFRSDRPQTSPFSRRELVSSPAASPTVVHIYEQSDTFLSGDFVPIKANGLLYAALGAYQQVHQSP